MYKGSTETAHPLLPTRWTGVLCILAGFYAIATIGYIFMETGRPSGSTDFHPYWYAGHFILQGNDPYDAFLTGRQPDLPITYIDGVTLTQYPVAQTKLAMTPAYTPVMLFVLTPFAFLSWSSAKWVFLLINIILMLITGWLVLRRIPFGGIRLSPIDELLLFLLYFDLSATRIAIENGQITLFVFLLMVLTLITVDRAGHVSGISLGLALSKYSLALAVFIFILYRKKYKIILLSLAVQILGILGLMFVSRQSFVTIISEYIQLFSNYLDQPGLQVSRWFASDNFVLSLMPPLVLTAFVFVPIFFWLRRYHRTTANSEDMFDFHFLTVLFIWSLLVAYHRLYDTLILFFFLVLVFKGLARPTIWKLSARVRTALLAFMASLPFVLILPARIVDKVLPEYYGRVGDVVTSFVLVLMLAVSMFLFRRFLQNLQTQSILNQMENYEIRTDPHGETQAGWADHS